MRQASSSYLEALKGHIRAVLSYSDSTTWRFMGLSNYLEACDPPRPGINRIFLMIPYGYIFITIKGRGQGTPKHGEPQEHTAQDLNPVPANTYILYHHDSYLVYEVIQDFHYQP